MTYFDTCSTPPTERDSATTGDPFDRLRQTAVFREGAYSKWRAAKLGIVGAGTIGGRLAVEAVRSGASICVWDPDCGRIENTGSQIVKPGVPKVRTVVEACGQVRAASCLGFRTDVRHAGIGQLRDCSLLIDCSDDPQLAFSLTEISNGLCIPLIRCAVDGSGTFDMGRVLCSDGGNTSACQLCSYSPLDFRRSRQRTHCPGQPVGGPPPTLAGGAIASAITGIGLLQAQRLITGNDIDSTLGVEIVLDLTNLNLHNVRLPRSVDCLSGHRRWNVEDLELSAAQSTVADVLTVAARRLGTSDTSITGYNHPLNTFASCACGATAQAVGTNWAVPPRCRTCGRRMTWFDSVQLTDIDLNVAESLGILNQTLSQLGYPEHGAMFVFRARGRRPVQAVLKAVQCGPPVELELP